MRSRPLVRALCAALMTLGLALVAAPSSHAYTPIIPSESGRTITLDGKGMTIDQVVAIARNGARVSCRRRLASARTTPICCCSRARARTSRSTTSTAGPAPAARTRSSPGTRSTPENKALIERTQLTAFRTGKTFGLGPEVAEEEIVRAMMAVRANTMTYEAASPQLTQMLLDFLNDDITPVVFGRGSPGEGDLPQMYQVAAAMVGVGDVYYKGQRMSASQALAQAGLQPLKPFGADEAALVSTNAFTVGQAALMVSDAQRMLNWSDLIYAMDLGAMNSSVTPSCSRSRRSARSRGCRRTPRASST